MKFHKKMKEFYSDIGRVITHKIKLSDELQKLISNGDPKPLRDMLKRTFGNSGYCGNDMDYWGNLSKGLILHFNRPLNNLGESDLIVSWSSLTVLLRDKEFRKNYVFKSQINPMSESQIGNHYCGSIYSENHCEHLLYSKKDSVFNDKKLSDFCIYCTSEEKIRKIGHQAAWTGLSPRFCPIRQQQQTDKEKNEANDFYECMTKDEFSRIKESKNKLPKKEKNTMPLATFNFNNFISESNQLKQIPINMLVSYHNHKFELYSGERLEDMVESIKENGVLVPIIVQPINDGAHYEILSGHNRTNASKLAGLDSVPAVIKENLSDDEAEMYVIETNLSQRGFNDLRISEQAAVLAMRHSKMFSEQKRQQIAEELEVMESKSKSKLEKTGEEYGLKKDTVARLLRVDKLIPEMKPWIDSKQLAVRAAVELSFISEDAQKLIYDVFKGSDGSMIDKIDIKKAKTLRQAFEKNPDMSEDDLLEFVTDKKNENIRKPLKIKPEFYLKYFDEKESPEDILNVIEKALEAYIKNNSPMAN